MTAMFKHDCDGCRFLGRYDSGPKWGGWCDLYFCRDCDGGTVLARYSDHGGDYRSGMIYIFSPARRIEGSDGYPLYEAYDRAVAQGLWVPKRAFPACTCGRSWVEHAEPNRYCDPDEPWMGAYVADPCHGEQG